jgi:hypothetical protein
VRLVAGEHHIASEQTAPRELNDSHRIDHPGRELVTATAANVATQVRE